MSSSDKDKIDNALLKNENLAGLAAPDTALSNLGMTTVGKAVAKAVDAAAGRAALGAQAADVTLTALAGLATGADQLPYSNGLDSFAQTPLTSFARSLLDDVSGSAALVTLGLPYETGTFTPVVSGSTTAGTGTYTTQLGRYTRIGNRVFYTVNIVWSGHTGTGTLRISLPLTSNAIASNNPISSILSSGLTFTNTPVGITPTASSLILVRENKPGAAMADIPIQATGTVIISGVYEV